MRCTSIITISPILSYTKNSSIIQLVFQFGLIPEMKENISKFSFISIDNLYKTEFTFQINNDTDDLNYLISMNFNKSIVGRPFLHYMIRIDDSLNNYYNLISNTAESKIQLMDIYKISDSEMKKINNSASTIFITNSINQGITGLVSFIGIQTSVFIRSLMVIELIFLLKFININYPPNIREIFQLESNRINYFFKYNYDETIDDKQNLPDLYRYYNISPHFLNNAGELIIRIFIVFCIAIIFAFIYEFSNNFSFKNKYYNFFKKLLNGINFGLNWPLTIFAFFNSLQRLIFYISSTFYFGPNTENGKINLIFAIFSFILLLCILCHFKYTIKKICLLSNSMLDLFPLPKNEEKEKPPLYLFPSFINEGKEKPIKIIDGYLPTYFKDKKILTFIEAGKSKKSIDILEDLSQDTISSEINVNNSNRNINNKSDQPSKTFQTKLSIFGNKYKNKTIFPENNSPKNSDKIRNVLNINNSKNSKIIFFIKQRIINKICLFFYSYKTKEDYIRKYGLLHYDFKKTNFFCKYYILFDFIRQSILSFIVVILFYTPIVSIIFICLIQLIFIIIIILFNPFKNWMLLYSTIFFELIITLAIGASLGIAIMDIKEDFDIEMRLNLGWIIIYCNLALLYSFLGLNIFIAIRERYNKKIFKQYCYCFKNKKNKIVPLKI